MFLKLSHYIGVKRMTKAKGTRMRPSDVPVKTVNSADELISFMSGGGVALGERGAEFVGAMTDYYNKPTIDASLVYDISKNNYVTEQVGRLKSLLFITPPKITVLNESEEEDEELSAELQAIWDSPDVDGWTKLQQAWVDMFTWGCALFNPVWLTQGSETKLHKLRRLPPESFGKPPMAKRAIYSQLLKGITLDGASKMECWQTWEDGQPHLIKNVMLVKDPTSSPLAGESQVSPVVPLVRMLDFAWTAQRQKVNRVGAPLVFIRFTSAPQKTTERDDIKHAKTILQNWGKSTAFMLRENMEIVKLEFADNQSAIQTIQQLEGRIKSYFSPATIIEGKGQTISESGGAKVDLVTEWIRGQHNMMEGIFERLLQNVLAENAYEGYLVEMTIPEPSPDRQLTMAQAKTGFDTQSLTTNEIRELLGQEALPEDELEALKEEYKARRPPPMPNPFAAPPAKGEGDGEGEQGEESERSFLRHAAALKQTREWEDAGFPHPDSEPGYFTFPQGEWQPPEAGGGAPKGLKAILRSVYSGCRDKQAKEGGDIEDPRKKEYCARVAWAAAKRAGWRKAAGKWVKHTKEGEEQVDDLEYELVEADEEYTERVVRALRNEPQLR
jgi:hypothetical protein